MRSIDLRWNWKPFSSLRGDSIHLNCRNRKGASSLSRIANNSPRKAWYSISISLAIEGKPVFSTIFPRDYEKRVSDRRGGVIRRTLRGWNSRAHHRRCTRGWDQFRPSDDPLLVCEPPAPPVIFRPSPRVGGHRSCQSTLRITLTFLSNFFFLSFFLFTRRLYVSPWTVHHHRGPCYALPLEDSLPGQNFLFEPDLLFQIDFPFWRCKDGSIAACFDFSYQTRVYWISFLFVRAQDDKYCNYYY